MQTSLKQAIHHGVLCFRGRTTARLTLARAELDRRDQVIEKIREELCEEREETRKREKGKAAWLKEKEELTSYTISACTPLGRARQTRSNQPTNLHSNIISSLTIHLYHLSL